MWMPSFTDDMRDHKTKKLAACSVLAAAALILSYVETLIPFSLGLPGVKVGFANIVIVYTLYRFGGKYALAVNVVRIALAGLLFGSPFSLLYALAGGLVSLAAMVLIKKIGVFSVTGTSMAGGVFHNLGQLIAAACVVETVQVIAWLPVLIFSGIAAGIVNGLAARLCLDRL